VRWVLVEALVRAVIVEMVHVLVGVPPTFRIADPIRSVPEWRGMNARTAQEIHS
jgi:hypothetical protein